MAAGAQHQYTAVFQIGAKLQGTFGGAMAQAKAKLAALHAASKRAVEGIGSAFRSLRPAIAGLFAGFAAFGAASIFHKIFSEATEAAIEAANRQRKLVGFLLQENAIRSGGRALAQDQAERLGKITEEMEKHSVLSKEVFDTGVAQLALAKIRPKQIADMIGPMSDLLVVTKGVNATQEDMQELAKGFGNAIASGKNIRMLKQFGIFVDQKLFSQKTIAQRYKFLLDYAKGFASESVRAMATPEGRVQLLSNRIKSLSREIGEAMMPARADMADAWREVLNDLEPVFKGIGIAAAKAATWAGKEISDMTKALSTPKAMKTWTDLGDSFKAIYSAISGVQAKPTKETAGTMFGEWWQKQLQDFADDLRAGAIGITNLKMKFGEWWADFSAGMTVYVLPFLESAYKATIRWIGLLDDTHIKTALSNIGRWIKESIDDPIGAGIKHLQELKKLLTPSAAAAAYGASMGTGEENWAPALGGAGASAPAASAAGTVGPMASGYAMGGAGAAGGPGLPVTVASYGGPEEPGQVTGAYRNALKMGDVAISPNLYPILGAPGPDNFVMLDGKRYHVADSSFYSRGNPTANMVEIWGYGNQIKRRGVVSKAMQMGGIVRGMTHALLGERGPEAVIPLSGGRRAEGLLNFASRALGMGGGATHVSFAPNIVINGNATEAEQRAMDSRLRDLASDFIAQFKRAQLQERRLSYEGGYA